MIRLLTNEEIERIGSEPISFRNGRGPVPLPELADPYDDERLRQQFRRSASGMVLPVRYDD